MSRLGYSLRLLARRALPHTPTKRWSYGLLLAAALTSGIVVGPVAGIAFAGAIVIGRITDIAVGSRRRSRLPSRPYFFEGDHPAGR